MRYIRAPRVGVVSRADAPLPGRGLFFGPPMTPGTCGGVGGGVLCEVLGDMGHRDVVEGDVSVLSLTKGEGVPDLDVTLLEIGQTRERNRGSTLTSEVQGSL